jgi:hypothetical protein
VQDRWHTTLEALEKAREHDTSEAKTRWLNHPHADVKLWDFTRDPKEEDSPDFHDAHRALTRLAEPSVQVVMLYRTAAGTSLDPGGVEVVDTNVRPRAAIARRLVERAVTLTDRRVVHELLKAEPPPGWQRSAVLRPSRLVELDAAGREVTDRKWAIRNDAEVGVEIIEAN